MAKSYWQGVVCDGPRSREAVKSWFSPLCDDMTPLKAEALCDIATDDTKKIRALMQDANGKQRWAIRTFGARQSSITLKSAIAAGHD